MGAPHFLTDTHAKQSKPAEIWRQAQLISKRHARKEHGRSMKRKCSPKWFCKLGSCKTPRLEKICCTAASTSLQQVACSGHNDPVPKMVSSQLQYRIGSWTVHQHIRYSNVLDDNASRTKECKHLNILRILTISMQHITAQCNFATRLHHVQATCA